MNRNANGGTKAPQITARNNARVDAKHWYSRNAIEKQALDVERAHLVWKQAWKHIGQALLERRQLREKAKAKAAQLRPRQSYGQRIERRSGKPEGSVNTQKGCSVELWGVFSSRWAPKRILERLCLQSVTNQAVSNNQSYINGRHQPPARPRGEVFHTETNFSLQ